MELGNMFGGKVLLRLHLTKARAHAREGKRFLRSKDLEKEKSNEEEEWRRKRKPNENEEEEEEEEEGKGKEGGEREGRSDTVPSELLRASNSWKSSSWLT